MLSWKSLTGIAEAMFKRGFKEGDVTGSPSAGVEECVGGILADEIGICACTQEVSCAGGWEVNFPGSCGSSKSMGGCICECLPGRAVAKLFGMIGLMSLPSSF